MLSLPNVMYTLLNGKNLYAALESPFSDSDNSGITSIAVSSDGSIKKAGKLYSTKGKCACHLLADANGVYAVNYISGSVIKIPDRLILHKGNSVNPTRQSSPHTHFISASPNGTYLFVTDLGTDRIYTYDKDLNYINKTTASAGSGPRHLAFSDDGQFAFCANELSSTVTMYSISDSVLLPIDEKSTLFADARTPSSTAAIRCKGSFVFVSNRGDDSIAMFSFDSKGLTPLKKLDCAGKSPRDFDIIEDLIVCTNELTDNVTVIDKDGNLVFDLKNIIHPLCISYKEAVL